MTKLAPHLARILPILFVAAVPAVATDLVVTRYDDPAPDGCFADDCSLREAIIEANAGPGFDRVLLSAGHYLLTIPGTNEQLSATGDLDIRSDLDIIGPGATMTTIDGGGLDRVLDYQFEQTSSALRGLSVVGGSIVGGIAISQAHVVIEDCEIRNNGSGTQGNGLQVSSSNATSIRRTTIANNFQNGLRATASTVSIENSTLSANGLVELSVSGGSVICTHCTIADLVAGSPEIHVADAGTLELQAVLIRGECLLVSGGGIDSLGGNFESPGNTCGLDQASDAHSANLAFLGAFGLHGGTTRTIPLLNLSGAIDQAPAGLCLAQDQRGAVRVVPPATTCDAGAYEQGPADPPTPLFADGFEQGDAEAWSATVG